MVLEPLNRLREPPGHVPDDDAAGVPDLPGGRQPVVQDPVRHLSPADHRRQSHPQHRQRPGTRSPTSRSGDNPGRNEPGTGEINYRNVFKHIHGKGFNGVVGMEHGNSSRRGGRASGDRRLRRGGRVDVGGWTGPAHNAAPDAIRAAGPRPGRARGAQGRPVAGDDADADRGDEAGDDRPERRDGGEAGDEERDEQTVPSASATPAVPPIPDKGPLRAGTAAAPRRRRAPTASRRPISRVRSVTLMNMTLAMPIAPMSRLTAASATVTRPIRALRPSNVAMIWSAVDSVKSLSARPAAACAAGAGSASVSREARVACAGLGPHVEHDALGLAEALAHGAGRQIEHVVLPVLAEEPAAPLLQFADHRVGLAGRASASCRAATRCRRAHARDWRRHGHARALRDPRGR